jgi:hypothetical protein
MGKESIFFMGTSLAQGSVWYLGFVVRGKMKDIACEADDAIFDDT